MRLADQPTSSEFRLFPEGTTLNEADNFPYQHETPSWVRKKKLDGFLLRKSSYEVGKLNKADAT